MFARCCGKKNEQVSETEASKDKSNAKAGEQPAGEAIVTPSQDVITRCMGGAFNRFIRKFRYVLIIVLFLIGVGAIVVASFIGPLTENEEMLPADHPILVAQNIITDEFRSLANQEDAFLVDIVWGVEDLDRSNVDTWDPESLGELIWDEKFDITPAAN